MPNIKEIVKKIKDKWGLAIAFVALSTAYVLSNFSMFAELHHAVIKAFAVAVTALALRSLLFGKTGFKYASDGSLESDLSSPVEGSSERLKQYRFATTVSVAIPTVMLILA